MELDHLAHAAMCFRCLLLAYCTTDLPNDLCETLDV